MEPRQRLIVGAIWISVAGLMAITIDPGMPSSIDEFARLFVVIVSLLLAVMYLFDPWNVISRKPFP